MKMFNPPHPGAVLADAMEELNAGIREMAKAPDMSPSSLQRLVTEQTPVSPEMAVRLSHVTGSLPEVWMRLQDTDSLVRPNNRLTFRVLLSFTDTPCGSETANAQS